MIVVTNKNRKICTFNVYEIQYLYEMLRTVKPSNITSDADIYRGNIITQMMDFLNDYGKSEIEPGLPF